MNPRSLFLCVVLLVSLVPAARSGENTPGLFGYKLGQHYEITDDTKFRLHGVIVVDPAGLTDGLDELQLIVTPKTHTIISIYGTVRSDDVAQTRSLQDQYWELLRAQFRGWKCLRLKTGPIILWKSPYWVQAETLRARTKGLFKFSVSLQYQPDAAEGRALQALRIEETQQLIADYQTRGL